MPLPVIPKDVFPNVPNVPGVPPLDRLGNKFALLEPSNVFSSQLQKVPYLRGILQAAKAEVWGVFNKDGDQVIVANVFEEMSRDASAKVARFFVEEGTFASYNKVNNPDETTIIMVKTGTAYELGTYMSEVEALKKSTELVDIITPERSLTDVNLESYNYARRRADGVNMITFNLSFVEVRQVTLAYSNRTIPSASALQDRGQQQAKAVRTSVLSKLSTFAGF